MVSSTSARLTTGARRLVLATLASLAVVAPPARAIEPGDPGPRTAQELAARIAAEQAANGPYSLELVSLLETLSVLHEEDGQYALSAAMIERAMQVQRANFGLRSLEQAPLIEQRIAQEEARRNFAAAWDLEQSLLALAAAHPEDLRTVPILRNVAAKRMGAAARYAAGEFPAEIQLGCFYNPSRNPNFGSCSAGSKGTALRGLVADARRHYRAAIDVLVRQGLAMSDEVRTLEMQIVNDSYRYDSHWSGRQALRRMLAYREGSAAPLLSILDAALQVGDWDLAFGNHPGALDIYEQIYDVLVERGLSPAIVEERFGSHAPVVVPTFAPNPFDAAQADTDAGYIDVAFRITKYGRGRRAQILAASADVTEPDRDALVSFIAQQRFRPRIVAGEFVDADIVARWHLGAPAPVARGAAATPYRHP